MFVDVLHSMFSFLVDKCEFVALTDEQIDVVVMILVLKSSGLSVSWATGYTD
jgi:hypothetical protein